MSCCKRHVLRGPSMLFTDPRFRSPSAMGAFGLTWACNDVDVAVTELKALLDEAKRTGLLTTHWFTADEGHPVAVAAQATLKGVQNNNLVIMSDEACRSTSAELNGAADRLRNLLSETGAQVPAPLRPDYTSQPSQNPLDQAKPFIIAGAVIAGAVVLAPIVFELVATARMFRTSRSRTARYGRRRS